MVRWGLRDFDLLPQGDFFLNQPACSSLFVDLHLFLSISTRWNVQQTSTNIVFNCIAHVFNVKRPYSLPSIAQ